jgi:hypothetical protein
MYNEGYIVEKCKEEDWAIKWGVARNCSSGDN